MTLQEIIESVDIVEYISQYVELEWRGDELWGISPFTSPPENTPSFSVRPATGKFYCFSSGIGGSVLTFIQYFYKVSKRDAVSILKKYAGIDGSVDDTLHIDEKLSATRVCEQYVVKKSAQKSNSITILPDNYMERYEDRPDKLQTWRDDGISDESMRYFGVKYDSFSDCIVYPIRDADGHIVNVGGRTLDADFKSKRIRKYTYFRGWGGQMSVIYGLAENKDDILRHREVILFEGVKSVMLARDFGFKNTGAIMTSHLNPGQMKVLARLGVSVVFALDKEIDVTADKNIQALKQYVNVSYLFDFRNLLGAKEAPVDRGKDVFLTLYKECRYKL